VSSPSAVVSSSAAVVQFGPSNSAEFAPVTAKSLTATPTLAGVQYPGTQAGNKAMATGFNEVYKKLDETSQCNPNDSNQATACVLGELASCQSDGTYVLKSCPNGQSCYAMPKPSGATGVEVSCAFPSDAAARMSGDSESSTSVVAASRATSTSQSAVTPIAGSVQSLSKFPETESVQMPVQRLSSTRQVTATPSSQAQAHTSAPEASVSAATETSGVQSTSHGTQSNSQTVAIPQSHQESPTAIADIQPSASSQAASSKQSVQTLQSFPSAEATLHTHEVPSTPSSTPSTSSPVHNQDASATHNGAAPETASAASSASMADGGRLFSLPTLAQNKLDKQVQPTASSADAQEASKAAPSPSAPTQQQPDRSMETSLAPVPHIPQAAPEAPQPTKVAAAKATPSSVDDSGIVVVPVGGPNSSVGSGANEKLAAPNTQQSATPIYITVTVTTTAYDHSPTA